MRQINEPVMSNVACLPADPIRPSARTARAENLAIAAKTGLPLVPIHGNSFPVRKVLWTYGGSYDRATRTWQVPRHKATEAQALADRFTKSVTMKEVTGEAPTAGIGAQTDAEVLALVAAGDEPRVKEAMHLEEVLRRMDGLLDLMTATPAELMARGQCTPAQAERIAAATDIVRRVSRAGRRERPSMRMPEEVHGLLGPIMAPMRHEEFWCLPLDPRSRLIGEPLVISRGDVDGTDAGPRAFFRAALSAGAATCIAVHNHPSGDASPSAADRAVTQRLVGAGRTVDVTLVDHVVIGDGGRFESLRRMDPGLFR